MMCSIVYCYRAAQESSQAGCSESNRQLAPKRNVEAAASAVEDVSDEEEIAKMCADLHVHGGDTQVCCYATCHVLLAQTSTKTCECTAIQPKGCTILCVTASHTLVSLHPICIPGLLMGQLIALIQKAADLVAHIYPPQQYMHTMCCHAELVLLVQQVLQVIFAICSYQVLIQRLNPISVRFGVHACRLAIDCLYSAQLWCNLQGYAFAHADSLQQQGGKGNKPKRSECCFNCGETGHGSRSCPFPKKEVSPHLPVCCICYAFTCY